MQRVAGFERHLQTPDHLWCDECTCSCGCRVFLAQEVKKGTTPPLFLTFKIPSNSPPLVQEEGDVTPKVECMVSNYSPRLSCSRWEHWSGSITPPYPLLPPPTTPTTTSPAMQPYLAPAYPPTNPPFLSLTLCVNLQLPTQSFIMASQHTGHPWSSSSQPHRERKEDSTADKHIAHQITNVYNDKHKPQRPAHAHIAAEH